MSAGQNASFALIGLIATCLLFGIFAGISHLNVLEKHAYAMEVGWQKVTMTSPTYVSPVGGCKGGGETEGFPLASKRPVRDIDPNGCLKAPNPLANAMNYAIYFAVACIIGAGVVNVARSRS